MKIEIKRPDNNYPLAIVHIPITHNQFDVEYFLAKQRMTILGKWEPDMQGGYKAPVLIEDEHVKPKKKAAPRSKR